MTTAKALRQLLDMWKPDADLDEQVNQGLRGMTNEQLRMAVLISAEMIKELKDEAIRRDVWDDFKAMKVGGKKPWNDPTTYPRSWPKCKNCGTLLTDAQGFLAMNDSDYQCPHCGTVQRATIEQRKERQP